MPVVRVERSIIGKNIEPAALRAVVAEFLGFDGNLAQSKTGRISDQPVL